MGIKGLLPFLKTISKNTSLKDIRGCTVAVDTYCWLHKAAICCSEKIALSQDTDLYLNYCLKYLSLLLSHDIKIILVFDGKNLPAKKEVEQLRRENRDINLKKAVQLMLEEKASEAKSFFDRCINISHDIALKLIKKAIVLGVRYIVAPYEADAQLAFLARNNFVDYVVTDDSDLLLFGAPKVLFKLDFNGNGVVIEKKDINKVLGFPMERYSFNKFRHICIISGCDYYSGIDRIGLITAVKMMKKSQLLQLSDFMQRINMYSTTKFIVTQDDIQKAVNAEQTILHQIVFDPVKRKQVPLTDYPVGVKSSDIMFAGEAVDDDHLAVELACGKRNPSTQEMVLDFDLDAKLTNDGQLFHYGLIRQKFDKSLVGRKPIDPVINRSKSVVVRCEFPWKDAAKSNADVDVDATLAPYVADDESFHTSDRNSMGDISNDVRHDEVVDLLQMVLDKGESVVHEQSFTVSKTDHNPFSNVRLARPKRFHFVNCDKENEVDDALTNVAVEEIKRPKMVETERTESSLTAKKIIAKKELFHIFRK